MAKIFTPHEYQHLMIQFILDHKRGALLAGMGMGKTPSTLTAVDAMQLSGALWRPTLVLAPLKVARSTWPKEAGKWHHLRGMEIQPIIGTPEERLSALRNTNASVFTMNYENLEWLVNHFGKKWPFQMVIPDESTRIKSFRLRKGGKGAAALGKVAHNLTEFWLNLTGTPAPNGLIDLWGQQWFIDKGERLGDTFGKFTERYFKQVKRGSFFDLQPYSFAQEAIQDKLSDCCLSLKAEDWFDIDDPIEQDIEVEMPKKAQRQYKEIEKQFFTEVNGKDIEALSASAKSVKLLQFASGAVYDEEKQWHTVHDEKLDALESVIEQFNGEPVLVSYHWKSDLARLQKRFKKGRVLDADPQTEDDWNAGKIPLLFAHPQSAGHGLNLQDGGRVLVFFSHWWNLEEYQQIIERIGPTRQMQAGHPRAVYIVNLVAKGTMDRLVINRRREKKTVQEILMEALKYGIPSGS